MKTGAFSNYFRQPYESCEVRAIELYKLPNVELSSNRQRCNVPIRIYILACFVNIRTRVRMYIYKFAYLFAVNTRLRFPAVRKVGCVGRR